MGDIDCHNCIGACCTRLMELPLAIEEADLLRQAGTPLLTMLEAAPDRNWGEILHDTTPETPYEETLKELARSLPTGTGMYQLLADCAFLGRVEQNGSEHGMAKCAIFDQPERPKVCASFQAGSKYCVIARLTRGIWDFPVRLTSKPQI